MARMLWQGGPKEAALSSKLFKMCYKNSDVLNLNPFTLDPRTDSRLHLFITALVSGASQSEVWIGGNDINNDDSWVWKDGSDPAFMIPGATWSNFWKSGEPDNGGAGGKFEDDHIQFMHSNFKTFNDYGNLNTPTKFFPWEFPSPEFVYACFSKPTPYPFLCFFSCSGNETE